MWKKIFQFISTLKKIPKKNFEIKTLFLHFIRIKNIFIKVKQFPSQTVSQTKPKKHPSMKSHTKEFHSKTNFCSSISKQIRQKKLLPFSHPSQRKRKKNIYKNIYFFCCSLFSRNHNHRTKKTEEWERIWILFDRLTARLWEKSIWDSNPIKRSFIEICIFIFL